jgi:hypothetical protein
LVHWDFGRERLEPCLGYGRTGQTSLECDLAALDFDLLKPVRNQILELANALLLENQEEVTLELYCVARLEVPGLSEARLVGGLPELELQAAGRVQALHRMQVRDQEEGPLIAYLRAHLKD